MGTARLLCQIQLLTETKGLTMREAERIFQLDPEPPALENMNDYIIEGCAEP